nr:MAG TPA: hypothetical protein [Caudoviricetes sp.]
MFRLYLHPFRELCTSISYYDVLLTDSRWGAYAAC